MIAKGTYTLPEVGPLYVHEMRHLTDPGLIVDILDREIEIREEASERPDALPELADTPLPKNIAKQIGPVVLWAGFTSEVPDPENMIGYARVGPYAEGSDIARKVLKAVEPLLFFYPARGPVYNLVADLAVIPEFQWQGVGEANMYTALKYQRQYRPVGMYVPAGHQRIRQWAEDQGLEQKVTKKPIMLEHEPDNHTREIVQYVSNFDTAEHVLTMGLRSPWLRNSAQSIDI